MTKLSHGGILPRVLTSIEEENVVTLDIETAVELVSLVGPSLDFCTKNPIAVVRPELEVN